MRTRNLLMLWLLGASFALPALATAQVVQAVSVSQERGQTLISITGERLPRPSVSVWRNQFLVLEFNARFQRARARGEPEHAAPHQTALRLVQQPPTQSARSRHHARKAALHAGADPHRLAGAFGQGDRGERGAARVQACRRRAEADRRRQCAPDAPTHLRARTERRARGDDRRLRRRASAPRPPARILVSLDFVNAEIGDVLKALAIQSGANIITAPDVKGTVTVSLSRLTVEESLNLITRLSGYRYEKIDNTYVVGTEESLKAFRTAARAIFYAEAAHGRGADLQGRQADRHRDLP
jgi:hypothetical protein